jgi:O-antigen ligase
MIVLTGTRSAVLTLAVFAVLWVSAGRWREVVRPRVLGLGLLAVAVFVLLSLAVSDSLWSRLVALGGDQYSSGRWPAIRHWLMLAADRPLGLGLGATRQLLAGGRPEIAGGLLLEWPHNEFIRFYVEGGVVGLLLVAVLVVEAVRRARRCALAAADPVVRVLVLAIAADMIVQCLLQNYFNTVYHATVLLMLLGMLAAETPSAAALPAGAGLAGARPGAAQT